MKHLYLKHDSVQNNLNSWFIVKILAYLTQIIHTNKTIKITNMTPPAMPPMMYANSLFSAQWGPVNDPEHLHDGFPLISFTQAPSFSQKPAQTSVHTRPVPLYPGLHSHLKSLVSGRSKQYALGSQCISTVFISHGFEQSSLLICKKS